MITRPNKALLVDIDLNKAPDLYEKLMASTKVVFDQKRMSLDEALRQSAYMPLPDRQRLLRIVMQKIETNASEFGDIFDLASTNTLRIFDCMAPPGQPISWRQYLQSGCFEAGLPLEFCESYIEAIEPLAQKFNQRFYGVLARMFRVPKLEYPMHMLPLMYLAPEGEQISIEWEEGIDIALEAVANSFNIDRDALANEIIECDYQLKEDKIGGERTTIFTMKKPSMTIEVRFDGRPQNILEFGQIFARLYAERSAPIYLLGEGNSALLGELACLKSIVFKYYKKPESRMLLANRLQHYIFTMMRGISMARFEMEMANMEPGPSHERRNKSWLKTNRDFFGETMLFPDYAAVNWCCVKEFIIKPHQAWVPGLQMGLQFALYGLAVNGLIQGNKFVELVEKNQWDELGKALIGLPVLNENIAEFWVGGFAVLDEFLSYLEMPGLIEEMH